MYTKQIPFTDFNNKPRNMTVHLNLMETEVFKLLREFRTIIEWRVSMEDQDLRSLDPEEVIDFYTALEEILLSAYGIPEADGLFFDKSDRYRFKGSALFNATMLMFVMDPTEATKMLDDLMPKGMQDLVMKADESLAKMAKSQENGSDMERQIAELRAQLAANESKAAPQA